MIKATSNSSGNMGDNVVLPRQVDPRKLAQKGARFKASLKLAELSRLTAALTDSAGEVVVDLVFGTDEQAHRVLSGTARTCVQMTCQRCLEPTSVELAGELSLAVVYNEEQAVNLPGHLEPWILADEGVADLYEMVEEELLLTLPMVAYHEEQCVEKALFSSGEQAVEAESEKPNPFDVLKQLKGSPE